MYLKELNIINFKNVASSRFEFTEKINCFVGNNGVGKTNILDAVHYLSLCKSGWGLSDRMCIRHGEEFFLLEGDYYMEGGRHEKIVSSYRKNQQKSIKRNGKEYKKIVEHIGVLPFVMVSPYDTAIINESGEERRRFVNSLISQIDKTHLMELIRYNTLLAQRNKMLKDGITFESADVLDILDMQLSELAASIYGKRLSVIKELAPLVSEYYGILSGDREEVTLEYRSMLSEKSMEELLEETAERDRILRYTTAGIHRDDIKMSIMDHPIRKYGSQGQQKSFLIALKLAQYDLLHGLAGFKPLLILDDIFDKLDLERVGRLIEIVSGENFGQIFISDCNKLRLQTILDRTSAAHTIFEIYGPPVSEEK